MLIIGFIVIPALVICIMQFLSGELDVTRRER